MSAVLSTTILGFVIYNVITIMSFRDLLKRFGYFKLSSRDFYECGFRPQTQKPINLPTQFMLICVFFLLYDIELIFLFPVVSVTTLMGLHDVFLVTFFFLLFLFSLIVDFNSHALSWQY